MTIYTSYFAKLKKLPSDVVPISICAKPPAWYSGLQYKRVAPTYNILMKYKGDHNEADYIEQFNVVVLNRLNPKAVVDELSKLSGGVDKIALLCFEKSSDFCHRHLVAKWLTDNGYPCEEWKES